MAETKDSMEAIAMRQKRVLGYIEQGLTQATMAQLEKVSPRTIVRDVTAVLGTVMDGIEQQKDSFIAEAVARWQKKREFLEVDLANLKGQRKKVGELDPTSGVVASLDDRIYRVMELIHKLDTDMNRFLQTTGHIRVAPTEVNNTLNTGKVFTVRFLREGEKKKAVEK